MSAPIQCSLDMLATALKMEEKGLAFYEKAARTCRDPQCREIFKALVEDETVHTGRIKQIHQSLTEGQCWTRDWQEIKKPSRDLSGFFRELAAKEKEKIKAGTSDLEAVDVGLDFELASIKFYQDQQARASDPLEAAFLEQMVLEEKDHWKGLKDTRYYLTDPEGWFIEKERAGLDGEE